VILDQIRRDSRIRRRFLLGLIGLALVAVPLAAVILALVAIPSREDTADRLAAIGAISGGAAVLLAFIAALVALLAYAVSTGVPNIKFRMQFDFSRPNNPSFTAEASHDPMVLKATSFKQTIGTISLHNTSRYSARNPAVCVRLQAMAFAPERPLPDGWAQLHFASTRGITAVQWDGGTQFSIHGETTRVIPSLDFDKLFYYPEQGSPAFIFEIYAEGYRREEKPVPVSFKVDGQLEPELDESHMLPDWV
jgi:hypothetical protein